MDITTCMYISLRYVNIQHHIIQLPHVLGSGVGGKLNFFKVFRNLSHLSRVQEIAPLWQLETLWKTQLDKIHVFPDTYAHYDRTRELI